MFDRMENKPGTVGGDGESKEASLVSHSPADPCQVPQVSGVQGWTQALLLSQGS